MNTSSKFDLSLFKARLKNLTLFLFDFAKNPVQRVRFLPDWDWPTIIILDGLFAALCGALHGIVNKSIVSFIAGLFILPLSSLITKFILSGFFFYTSEFVFKRELKFKKVFQLIIIASLPFMVIWILSPLLAPLPLLGLAVTGLLLIVGFVENFGIPRKSITRLVAGLYIVYCLLWIASSISLRQYKSQIKNQATPESLDILERELKGK